MKELGLDLPFKDVNEITEMVDPSEGHFVRKCTIRFLLKLMKKALKLLRAMLL